MLWMIKSDQKPVSAAPGPSSAVAPCFLMILHRMNTRGSKSSTSSTGTGVLPLESWLDVVQAGRTQI